jgi:hypothetical protein
MPFNETDEQEIRDSNNSHSVEEMVLKHQNRAISLSVKVRDGVQILIDKQT